jgi:prevent-host-death family protein
MKQIFNLAEARAKLSQLVDLAHSGEMVQLARRGVPVAQIIPIRSKQRPLLGEFEPLKFEITPELLAPAISAEDWEAIQRRSDLELVKLLAEMADEKSDSK